MRRPDTLLDRLNRLLSARVAVDTGFTLAALVAPLVAGFFSIPFLIAGMGDERFGMLAIVWLVLGYFSVFDLGLGRAVAFAVSQRLGKDPNARNDDVFGTAIPLLLVFGAVGGLAIFLLSDLITTRVLKISDTLSTEGRNALLLSAVGLPLVTTTVGMRGFLEGHGWFKRAAAVRSLLGCLVFVSPLLVLPFTVRLDVIVAALMATKLLGVGLYGGLSWFLMSKTSPFGLFNIEMLRHLLSFGGWLTVSNVISPLMVHMDRFVIGSVVSVAMVTYYVTPFEVVSKLLVIAGAASTVLFPTLTRQIAEGRAGVYRMVIVGSGVLGALISPAVLFFVVFAAPFMSWWIDPQFAQQSADVMRVLAVGMLVNTLAVMPFIGIHAATRPDLTAKIHMLELPLYAFAIFVLTRELGILGTALAWLGRVSLDTLLMHAAAFKVVRGKEPRAMAPV